MSMLEGPFLDAAMRRGGEGAESTLGQLLVEPAGDLDGPGAVLDGKATPLALNMDCEEQDGFVLCKRSAGGNCGVMQDVNIFALDFTLSVRFRIERLSGTAASILFSSGHSIGLDSGSFRAYFVDGGSLREAQRRKDVPIRKTLA